MLQNVMKASRHHCNPSLAAPLSLALPGMIMECMIQSDLTCIIRPCAKTAPEGSSQHIIEIQNPGKDAPGAFRVEDT